MSERSLPEEARRKRPIEVRTGNVEFSAIEPSGLASIPVVIQALDNQWMPRSLLYAAVKEGRVTAEIEESLKKTVRAEYLRALINSEQVILNRAFLYNNQAIFQDYATRDGQSREAFKALLADGVIIPFLFTERSPVDAPVFSAHSFAEWQQMCQEVHVRCVRFSWDDQLNQQLVQQPGRRFQAFALSLASLDLEKCVKDLGLDHSAKDGLRKRFIAIARLCLEFLDQGRFVTRAGLYQQFVTAGNDPTGRQYDGSKPFAAEIKQLIDLAYNSYIADALGGLLLTPVDSLPRTALQEWQQPVRLKEITAEGLVSLLKETSFDLIVQGLYLKSISSLTLQDVREIRRMDEWAMYIQRLEKLLMDPLQFSRSAQEVYQNYARLMAKITKLVKQRDLQVGDDVFSQWTPTPELIIQSAGATLSIHWTPEGPVYHFSGEVSPQVTPNPVPLVARLGIRGDAGAHAPTDLPMSIEFLKGSMRAAQQQWKELQNKVKQLQGFKESSTSTEEEGATINYLESLEE